MDDTTFDLTGQVALVTGGNSGVGLGLAAGLARAGSAVCIWGTNPGKNAAALGKYGIRANTLLPGWTRSPQFDAWLEKPGAGERIMPRIPLRRWGEPEDWGGIAVYLASPASSFHTGDAFRIDGGYGVF